MTVNKELAVASLVMTGIIVRGVLKPDVVEQVWLGHLDSIAELLRPSYTYSSALRLATKMASFNPDASLVLVAQRVENYR